VRSPVTWRDNNIARLALALSAACAVNAPSLKLGLFGDDFAHRRFILDHLRGQHAYGSFWNMFDSRVASGAGGADPSSLFGRLPWWASKDFSFALLRPLSTASHYLDYILWPEAAWAMHAHNVVLFGLMLWIAGDLYRRLLGAGLASWLALMAFAIDDVHTVCTAWIASRNTLLTAGFTLLTLWFYQRGVSEGRRFCRCLAAPALLCAHASSEGAIACWAYLLAYAAFLDRRALSARLRTLFPLAAVSLAWLTLSALLGYGVRGSGIYIDPRRDPLEFGLSVVQRLPALLELQFGLPPEFSLGLPAWARDPVQLFSHAYLALLLVAMIWLARREALTRFFAAASLLALLPQCAAGSFARLLLLSGFGAHGLIADIISHAVQAFSRAGFVRRLSIVTLTAATVLVHGLVAVLLPGPGLAFSRAVHASVLRAAESLPAGIALQHSTIMVLNFPDYLRSVFVGLYRNELFAPGPQRMHMLGVSPTPVRISRPSLDAIDLQAVGGYLLDATTLLVRRPAARFVVGARFQLQEASIEVLEVVADGRPARIRIQSPALARSSLLWVTWSEPERRFRPVTLPELGASDWL
jgi:hypothetical protein